MRSAMAWILAFGLSAPVAANDVEKPSALNGSQYAVISPLYDGTGGSMSYIRLFNGQGTTTTFNITVVKADNAIIPALGTVSIQVPSHASPQYPLVAAGGSNSIFSQAGVADSPGTTYALYIQDTDPLTGYEHVTFNGITTLFENSSLCTSLVNQQLATNNTVALPNVHTSQIPGYPSTISIANYSSASTTVTLTIVDAATGNTVGTMNKTIGTNATLLLPESQIESQLNFRPTSAQPHINILFTNAAGGAPPIEVGQSIVNSQLGGAINMSGACAVNPVSTATATPALPTAYCGIVTYPVPYTSEAVYFTASIAPDGFIYAAVVDLSGVSAGQGEWYSGTLTGTTATLHGSRGDLLTGTLQNGAIRGVFPTPYGNGSYAGSTTSCR